MPSRRATSCSGCSAALAACAGPNSSWSWSSSLIGFLVCMYFAQALDAFAFGDDAAASLGIPVSVRPPYPLRRDGPDDRHHRLHGGLDRFCRPRRAACGALHCRPVTCRLLPTCVVAGGIFMVLADIVSRVVLPQQVLPIGVVTALVGVPVLLDHSLSGSSAAMTIRAENLTWNVGRTRIVDGVSLAGRPGQDAGPARAEWIGQVIAAAPAGRAAASPAGTGDARRTRSAATSGEVPWPGVWRWSNSMHDRSPM